MIKENINEIISGLNLQPEIVNSLFNTNYSKILSNDDISFKGLCDFAEFLNINCDQLILGDYDLELLKKKFITPSLAIPSEYLRVGGTFIDTIRGIVDYLELTYGSKVRKRFLNYIQLTEPTLVNSKLIVNANCLLKVGKFLAEINIDRGSIGNMATFVNTTAKRKLISEHINECRFGSEVAQKIVDITNSHYDKNFSYHFEKKGNRFAIVGTSEEEIHDELKLNIICDEIVSNFKAQTVANSSVHRFGKKLNLVSVEDSIKKGLQVQKFIFKESMLQ